MLIGNFSFVQSRQGSLLKYVNVYKMSTSEYNFNDDYTKLVNWQNYCKM